VLSSNLGRAVETTQIAFAGSGIRIYLDWRLRECNYGELNATPVAELDARRRRHLDEPFPRGESYRDVVRRKESFLGDVARMLDGRRIVVIGHAATHLALDHLVRDVALEGLLDAPFAWQEGWLYVLPRT
jgi:broad specificity phosphatase PhoE